MKQFGSRRQAPPLDAETLERLAVGYAGRYATTRAKLRAYLARKLRERGWAETTEPPVERLVERCAALGYVDDKAFATAKAASLGRRGFGIRRVDTAFHSAGIDEEDGEEARALAREGEWDAALRFAERKRIGPFAALEADSDARRKALGALLRAGHPMEIARPIAAARPGEVPERDVR